ncbi:hypothetical protein TNCV_2888851 [Trichonephila clavipes]|nr:hypothetical protein TNCV_2888851 [Trichonephila clavipes]
MRNRTQEFNFAGSTQAKKWLDSPWWVGLLKKLFPGQPSAAVAHGRHQEFESSTTKDPPCRGAMHVKSVESSNVLPLEDRRGGASSGVVLVTWPWFKIMKSVA